MAHHVGQKQGKRAGVGTDTLPLDSVGTRGSPASLVVGGGDLVCKNGRDEEQDAGEDAHAGWKDGKEKKG